MFKYPISTVEIVSLPLFTLFLFGQAPLFIVAEIFNSTSEIGVSNIH